MAIKFNKELFPGIFVTAAVFVGGALVVVMALNFILMPLITRQGSDTEVPSVIDMSLQAAETKLQEAELGVAVGSEEYDAERPKGTVINQVPDGGSIVKTGRKVILTLSKGSASAQVPMLEGFTLREARLLLEKEGLQPGGIVWQTDESRPDGVVISSVPAAGTIMKLNAEVQLIVNRIESEMMVRVPRFIGLDLDEARALAEENFLLIGDLSYSVNNDLLPETVVAQSVPIGLTVKKWTTVNLTITTLE
jgi:serine/threonine-protein kinase